MRAWPHPDLSEIDISVVLHALSDPIRLRIVRMLGDGGERSAGTLVLDRNKGTFSHHFRVLREAGVTRTRQEGKRLYVSLRRADLERRFPGLLDAVLSAIAAHDGGGEPILAHAEPDEDCTPEETDDDPAPLRSEPGWIARR